MINIPKQLRKFDFHGVCRWFAEQFSLPEAFICYLLFEKLYLIDTRRAIVFFIESELTGFLFKVKGRFELLPIHGSELVQFEDGTSIGSEGSTMTWHHFFQLVYIDCAPERLHEINSLLTEYLQEHSAVEQFDIARDLYN